MSILAGAALIAALTAQTDTVIPLEGARSLSVETQGGSIVVRTWERSEIRIQAEHSSRTFIEIDRRGERIDIEAEARAGPSMIVDYVLTVPTDLDLDLEGHYTRIEVEGTQGEVTAETFQGDIRIVGGRGTIRAETVMGDITIQGGEGALEVESVGGDIRLTDVAGEIVAETVGGAIVFENALATRIDAGSVGGRIVYDGTIAPGGSYFFGTHGGAVSVTVPEGVGAQLSVATIHGSVRSDLQGSPARFPRGQRTRFRVGDGSANIEVETFAGTITLTRQGAPAGGDR